MEPLSKPVEDASTIELPRFERACAAAIAATAAAGSARSVIDSALRALHDELGGPGVAAFVLEHGRLWSVAVRGYAMIPDGLPLDEGVIGRAIRTSEPQLVLDVSTDPDFVEVSRATVSELSAPLLMPTGVVGVLNIETGVPLPVGSAEAAAELLRVLAEPMDELRGSRADLSSLARLFVYMKLSPRPAGDRGGGGALARPRASGRDEPAAPARRRRRAGRVDRVERDPAGSRAPDARFSPHPAQPHRRVGRVRAPRHDRGVGTDSRVGRPQASLCGPDSVAGERR